MPECFDARKSGVAHGAAQWTHNFRAVVVLALEKGSAGKHVEGLPLLTADREIRKFKLLRTIW